MSTIGLFRRMRELRHCMPDHIIQNMEWVEGKKPKVNMIKREKHIVAAKLINSMLGYIVDRVAEGDICRLPDKNDTMIYMGFNYPLAIERMKAREDYPYKEGITPAFIRISSSKNPRTYLSLFMARPSREWLVDKINEGRDYYQPIPLHSTYHLDRKKEEIAAWERLQKEKEWNTLTWTI